MSTNELKQEIKIVINRDKVINTNIAELLKLISNNESNELENLLNEINKESIKKEPKKENPLNNVDNNNLMEKRINEEKLLKDIEEKINKENLKQETNEENLLNNINNKNLMEKRINEEKLLRDVEEKINKENLNNASMLAKRIINPEDFVLYENGIFSNITLGKTTSEEVIESMRAFNKSLVVNEQINVFAYSYMYQDLDVTICFDENNISQEITLGKNFKGKTFRGLKIGDSLEKSVVLYGEPDKNVKTNMFKLFSWKNFTIFFQDDKTSHIRIRI